MPINYDIMNLYPKGLKGAEDIADAVNDALKTLFQAGLDPESTKIALTTLREMIDELLTGDADEQTLDQ